MKEFKIHKDEILKNMKTFQETLKNNLVLDCKFNEKTNEFTYFLDDLPTTSKKAKANETKGTPK